VVIRRVPARGGARDGAARAPSAAPPAQCWSRDCCAKEKERERRGTPAPCTSTITSSTPGALSHSAARDADRRAAHGRVGEREYREVAVRAPRAAERPGAREGHHAHPDAKARQHGDARQFVSGAN
jgi:hypothetical protein